MIVTTTITVPIPSSLGPCSPHITTWNGEKKSEKKTYKNYIENKQQQQHENRRYSGVYCYNDYSFEI
jgi:hypothetical protein